MATLENLDPDESRAFATEVARMLEIEPEWTPCVVPERYRIDPDTEPTGYELRESRDERDLREYLARQERKRSAA